MNKKVYVIILMIFLILTNSISGIFATENKYSYTRESILENNKNIIIYDTKSPDYMFEHGIELLKAGLYEESIDKFKELRVKHYNELVSKMSYIYEGISLVRMSEELEKSNYALKAINTLKYITTDLSEFITNPSEDLVKFYIALSKRLRNIDAPFFDIADYMEYSMIFFDGDIIDDIYTELGNMNYMKGNFYTAIPLFEKSDTPKSMMGLAKCYTATGDLDKAIITIEYVKNNSTGDLYNTAKNILAYYKSLSNNPDYHKKSDASSGFSDADGPFINGVYKIVVESYITRTQANKIKTELNKSFEDISFNILYKNGIYQLISNSVYDYGKAKTYQQRLNLSGYDNAFLKDIAYN